jgi:hypothetical protein
MGRVFISYRREDASGHAGRLYDHLVEHLGGAAVFLDVDTIPPGEKFDSYIEENLRDCFMCIVVIGRLWSAERLHAEGDFVRREIIGAFARGIRVIPVLFDGAKMPHAANLPAELTELANCQAYDFGSGRDFKQQVAQLLKDVDRANKEAKQRKLEQSRETLRGFALRPHQYPIWVLFVCALIVLSAFASLTWVPTQMRALGNLWLAEAANSKGNYSLAVSHFRDVLGKVPSSREAKIGLSIALFSSRSSKDAEEALDVLEGLTISQYEWERLARVMPIEYQKYFDEVKKQ